MSLLAEWIDPENYDPDGDHLVLPFVSNVLFIVLDFEITSSDLVKFSELLRLIEFYADLKGVCGHVLVPNAVKLLDKW